VDLDLAKLREMHPVLPFDVALVMVGRAALALERNAHKPGVSLSLDLERILSRALLSWPAAELSNIDQHDHNRITEEGAEVVALVLAHRYRSWQVVRRMQRGDHADWLLADVREGAEQEVALEISGVDRGSITARLSEKLSQVGKNTDADQRWACVVGFEEPMAALRFIEVA
jgi:hypothetical protein